MIRAFHCILFALLAAPVVAQERLTLDLGGGVKMELMPVSPGKFLQGSPEAEAGRNADEAQHEVTLTRPFHMGVTPVTRAQWERFILETRYKTEAEDGKSGGYGWDGTKLTQRPEFTWRNPGFAQDGSHPVTLVTWEDTRQFLQWLGRRTNRVCVLPTEAQWEYACRAGTTTPWPTGSDAAAADAWAWHKGNAGGGTHPVGQKRANAWGLQDMGGQVWEWCQDWYAPYPAVPQRDPLQTNDRLSDKPRRVLRGGSFLKDAAGTRSATRYRNDAKSRNADNGFRVVILTPPPSPTAPKPATPSGAGTTPPVPSAPAVPMVERPDSTPPVSAPAAPASQPVRSAPEQHTSASERSSGGSFLRWLLAIPIIAILWKLFRKFTGGGAAAGGGYGGATALNEPVDRGPRTRLTGDGFWITCGLPEGTLLRWQCRTADGPLTGEVAYAPGPDGMFIFTGAKPLEAFAWEGEAAHVPPPLPDNLNPPGPGFRMGVAGGMLHEHLEQQRQDELRRQHEAEAARQAEQERAERRRSTSYPSAY